MTTAVRLVIFGGLAVVGIAWIVGLLVGMPIAAVIAAIVSGVSIQTDTAASNPQPIRVAVVDDDAIWYNLTANITLTAFSGATVIVFTAPTPCESLLTSLTRERFNLYIVDNQLDEDHLVMWGPDCTREILKSHPGAVVVGLATSRQDPGFVANGARAYVSKLADVDDIIRAMTTVLR